MPGSICDICEQITISGEISSKYPEKQAVQVLMLLDILT